MNEMGPIGRAAQMQNYNPFTSPQKDNPHPIWKSARDTAPAFWSDVLGAWVVTRYQDVCEVLGNPDVYLSAGGMDPFTANPPEVEEILARGLPAEELKSVLALDAPEHTRIKKFLVAIFTPRRINALEPRVREITNNLIDGFIDRGHAEFVSEFAYPLPLNVVLEMIGIPVADAEQLHTWSTHKMSLQWGSMDLETHKAAARGFVDFQMYLKRLIDERRRAPKDDVVSALIELRQLGERPLTDGEIIAQMMSVIAAGHETTMNMLSITLWHTLKDRDLWRSLCQDKSLIPGVIEEGLRFDSPSQSLWRRTARDVVLAGVAIAAGQRISAVIASGNRDDQLFNDPHRFDPRREGASQHLSFGRGLHYCVGAALTRLEGRVAFEALSERIPSLVVEEGFEPAFAPNATQRFLEALPIGWDVSTVR